MAEWKEFTVADVISTVIDYRGKTPKKLGGDWSDSGYRALSAKNIKTGKIVQPDSIRFVSEEMYKNWMKEEIQREDILITSEAPFGQIYYWDSDEKIVLSQRLFAIRINELFYPKFIYFFMTSSFFQAELDGRATGTTVVGLRQPELLKCKIFAPEYQEQKKIADILWCLEQNIINNEAINNNLAA
jgi:type I restriction enzyme S subunit